MGKFCSNCGNSLKENDVYCNKCGCNAEYVPNPYPNNIVYYPQMQTEQNAFAITGFILSLVPIFFIFIFFRTFSLFLFSIIIEIVGLVLSCIGMSKAKKLYGKGKGLAIAGLVISIIFLFFALSILGYYFSMHRTIKRIAWLFK